MSSSTHARALYLRVGSELVFGVLHPVAGARPHTAVLICPPFGWEEVCSYRARRDWAVYMAARGWPALRIDLPGSGDSSGTPDDPHRLQAWSDAVAAASTWLRDRTEARSLTAVGIGLGGLLIGHALAAGAQIDQAVLWASPAKGRTLVRELRAFARLESAQVAVDEEAAVGPAVGMEAGGFSLSEETCGALEALDLSALQLSTATLSRALLLGRDGMSAESGLRAHLHDSGIEVTVADGEGYGAMMAEPQFAQSPQETFAQVAAWLEDSHEPPPEEAETDLGERADVAEPHAPARVEATRLEEIELTIDGARVRERATFVEQPFGRLFGIVAEPLDVEPVALGAVLLNAGAIRRIGPNRMWVEIARRWAARGVPTLRLDLEGIGDADGDADRFGELAELYVPEMVDQVRDALDTMEREGVASRFVLLGLCSGAYWSFHGALADDRVTAALMLNPQTLFWDASQETVRELRKAFLLGSSWLRLLRGGSSMARAGELLREIPAGVAVVARRRLSGQRAAAPGDDALQDALCRLERAGKHCLFVFSGDEPLYRELDGAGGIERLERWPSVELVRIPGHDHTLRPRAARRGAFEALDRALAQELERVSRARDGFAPGPETV
jgi:alpha-beta hydrolase superfamily lysophospholipase